MVRLGEQSRRLPGFRFEAQAPPAAETLPRMDIVSFVGFASSGPVGIPVAVESIAQFTAIFGVDALLARDRVRGTQTFACLAPAVRSFFRNGGVRCWVTRVARREISLAPSLDWARDNIFPIPGMIGARFQADPNDPSRQSVSFAPAGLRSRSAGSWSDDLRIGSALQSRSAEIVQIVELSNRLIVLDVVQDQPSLDVGELMRLTFRDGVLQRDYLLMFTTQSVRPQAVPGVVRLTGTDVLLFSESPASGPASPPASCTATVWTHETGALSPPAGSTFDRLDWSPFEREYHARIAGPTGSAVSVDLFDLDLGEAPLPGSFLHVRLGLDELLLIVDAVGLAGRSESDSAGVRVMGRGFWLLRDFPPLITTNLAAALDALILAERLTFEISVHDANDYSLSLSDMAFSPAHERYCGNLPTDEDLYLGALPDQQETPEISLWRQVGDLSRFPLAGLPHRDVFLPVSMSGMAGYFLERVRADGTALERDGLANFGPELFLDEELASTGVRDLMAEADFIRYSQPVPRRLYGIHATLGIEETTLVCVPDAVHRGWVLCSPASDAGPLPANPTPAAQTADAWFVCLPADPIRPPALIAGALDKGRGTFTLRWFPPDPSDRYVLEESFDAAFGSSHVVYSGPNAFITVYGRVPGDYFYRVRAVRGATGSEPSTTVRVAVGAAQEWFLITEKNYSSSALLSVQRALINMCAARADVMAVLSLPEHYREDQAIEHLETLQSIPDTATLSYAAAYHPWLTVRDADLPEAFGNVPPCGAACGQLAHRALTRGAWIAPANDELKGIVGLMPPIARERHLDLQDAQLNLIRHEPRGFLLLSAETLSLDEDLRQINVRRLLILLRRLALRLGPDYTFEPNNAPFRRAVERGFTEMLDQMFMRGAFAGSTAAASYQVVVSDAVNTAQSIQEGRFIVELRVAPSLPMRFLTLRLVQANGRSLVTEG